MIMHLGAPKPSMVVSLPYSTSPSVNKTTITCGGSQPNLNFSPAAPATATATPLHSINVNAVETYKKQAIEKRVVEHINWKPITILRQPQKINVDDIFGGRLVQSGLVFQQNFMIRSSEIGPDCKAHIGPLISLLQETTLNHFKIVGILAEGFGTTPEMSRRNLIWVICKMQIVVDSYPSWGDEIQIETWTCASGKNGMRRDWILRDYKTGKTLLRAVCVYVMMDKRTRKMSKFIAETREETKGFFMDVTDPIVKNEDGCRNLRDLDIDTADHVRTGILPKWSDLDVNQHVNHGKYIDWILESAPQSIFKSHSLSAMTLEYKKECGIGSVLQSLSSHGKVGPPSDSTQSEKVELDHTIRLQNQSHILLRGRTIWMPKSA